MAFKKFGPIAPNLHNIVFHDVNQLSKNSSDNDSVSAVKFTIFQLKN